MNKILRFLSFTFLLVVFSLLFSNDAKAISGTCSCSADPSTGPSNQGFTVSGNCQSESGTIAVTVYNSSNVLISTTTATTSTNSFTANIPASGTEGTFRIVITDGAFQGSLCGTFTAQAATAALKCGDVTSSQSAACPGNCPSTLLTGSSWYCSCGDEGQTCCPSGNAAGKASCWNQGSVCESDNFCRGAVGPGVDGGTVTGSNIQGTCTTPGSVDTAIGCIPVGDLNSFAAFFLRWGMGIAGGIGMLFLVYASFQIITSQGDPKRLQTGRELLTSAISGIILLVFSVFILRILGVNVLGIF